LVGVSLSSDAVKHASLALVLGATALVIVRAVTARVALPGVLGMVAGAIFILQHSFADVLKHYTGYSGCCYGLYYKLLGAVLMIGANFNLVMVARSRRSCCSDKKCE